MRGRDALAGCRDPAWKPAHRRGIAAALGGEKPGMKSIEKTARGAVPANDSPTHPEETKARVKLRIGKRVSLMATARTTPAGLVSVGVMVAAILLSAAALVHTARRKL